MLPRGSMVALSLSVLVACQPRDAARRTDTLEAPRLDSVAPSPAPLGPLRAIGTEPFWGLDIDTTGLRFTTPDDMTGIHWPPRAPLVTGDTWRWAGESGRAAIAARIWPARCSDGMSDRVYPYAAFVRVDGTDYRGCAASRSEFGADRDGSRR